jgi:uncharacterized protein YraI
MTIKFNVAKTLGVGAVFALVSGGAALAAIATGPADVYSGPGTNYRVVNTVGSGEDVNIERTAGNWCLVQEPGPNGWVNCGDLAEGYGLADPEARPAQPSPEFTGGHSGGHQPPDHHHGPH